MGVRTFHGRLDNSDHSDPQKILNWLQSMDRYFTRHLLSETEKVSFATMKLIVQASQYWSILETLCELRGEYLIETWHDMIQKYNYARKITELKKTDILVQYFDASNLGYIFKSQNYRVPIFKSSSYQYSH